MGVGECGTHPTCVHCGPGRLLSKTDNHGKTPRGGGRINVFGRLHVACRPEIEDLGLGQLKLHYLGALRVLFVITAKIYLNTIIWLTLYIHAHMLKHSLKCNLLCKIMLDTTIKDAKYVLKYKVKINKKEFSE